MRRRALLALIGAAATGNSLRARAQQHVATARVGLLSPGPPISDESEMAKPFLRAMAAHGYVPGRNLTLEKRAALGRKEDLPKLVQELAAAKVDVVVTVGFASTLAAKAASLPIIAATGTGDPVATGLIETLKRPGGMITGISDDAVELTVKRLALLRELAPGLRRIAMLWNQDDLGMDLRARASMAEAIRLGVEVGAIGVQEPNDFGTAFDAMDRSKPDAILMVADVLTILNRRRVTDYALARRIPAIYEIPLIVRDGGLMSYGADLGESFERAAALVARVLGGAKPGDLPFEQPTQYRFVLNLKTAAAIGLEVSSSLLARADEVIE